MSLTATRLIFLFILIQPLIAFIILRYAPKDTGALLRELGITWQRLKIAVKAYILIVVMFAFLAWQPQTRLQTVESSFIHAIGYDEWRGCIIVEMTSGASYAYYGFSRNVFERMLSAESKGEFYNSKVKLPSIESYKLWY